MSDDPGDRPGAGAGADQGGEPDPDELKPPEPYPRGLARIRRHVIDLSPLRMSREFRLLFLGQAVSDLGSEITFVAVPFQVFRLTGSTLAVGLLGLCDLVPLLVTPIVGGVGRGDGRLRALARVPGSRSCSWLSPGPGDMVSGIFHTSIAQSVVSDDMRGRLEGMGLAVWATGPALGNVEAGVVASAASVPFSIVSGGLACLVGVAARGRGPRIPCLRRPEPHCLGPFSQNAWNGALNQTNGVRAMNPLSACIYLMNM